MFNEEVFLFSNPLEHDRFLSEISMKSLERGFAKFENPFLFSTIVLWNLIEFLKDAFSWTFALNETDSNLNLPRIRFIYYAGTYQTQNRILDFN